MAVQRFRHGSNFALTTIALFVILAVVNLFSYRRFVRWDLTANREYTVSQTTRDLLRGMENLINIKVYLSKNLPAELLTFDRQLRDLLNEYEAYGKGKLRIEFITPSDKPEEQRELMFQGVRPQAVGVYKKDTATQAQVYNSIVVQFENQREVIDGLLDQVGRGRVGLRGDFEYLLTSNIFKCQRTGHPVIGWLTNAPNLDLNKDFRTLREAVRREWDIRDIRLDPLTRIPQDIAVLVVVRPADFTNEQLFEIDQYLMRGGKVLALVELYDRDYQGGGLRALAAKPTNFTRLLETYGVKVNQDVVLDPQYPALAPFGFIPMPYEFWVTIVPKGLDKNNPAVARLSRLTLHWAQTLDKSSSAPGTVQMIPLAQTSSNSFVRWGAQVVPEPRVPSQEQSKVPKPHTVIAALTGVFPSHFPEGTPYPADKATTSPAGMRTPESERKYTSPETRMIVVGNSLFLQDIEHAMPIGGFTVRGNNNNATFFMNALEWLGLGKGLSEIRTREWAGRPIKPQIPDGQRVAYKVAGTFTMPVLVIIGGIAYNILRRRRRRLIADRLLER